MKKLMMFAAAMTIVGGAYAQCSDPDPIDSDCMLTYNVKMNLKTVSGKAYKGTVSNPCADDMPVSACIRFPKVGLALDGYLFVCGCDCDDLADTEDCFIFLGNKKLQTTLNVDEFGFDFVHILGNGKSAEASWALYTDGDFKELIGPLQMIGTGFGTFNPKLNNGVFTSFSGATVGWIMEPICILSKDCDVADYYLCDGTLENEDPSILYGTWAMKLNTKFSGRKAGSNISALLRAAFPTWAYNQFSTSGAFDCAFGVGD